MQKEDTNFIREIGLTVQNLPQPDKINAVRVAVRAITQTIDREILAAHRQGHDSCKYSLPSDLAISGLDRYGAQLLVYSELLTIYGSPIEDNGKGFDVRIGGTNEQPYFELKWKNGMSAEERDARQKIIDKHRISPVIPFNNATIIQSANNNRNTASRN